MWRQWRSVARTHTRIHTSELASIVSFSHLVTPNWANNGYDLVAKFGHSSRGCRQRRRRRRHRHCRPHINKYCPLIVNWEREKVEAITKLNKLTGGPSGRVKRAGRLGDLELRPQEFASLIYCLIFNFARAQNATKVPAQKKNNAQRRRSPCWDLRTSSPMAKAPLLLAAPFH